MRKKLTIKFSIQFSLPFFKLYRLLIPIFPLITPTPRCLLFLREADEILNRQNWVLLPGEGKTNNRGQERFLKALQIMWKDSWFHTLHLPQNSFSVLLILLYPLKLFCGISSHHKDEGGTRHLTSVCWDKAGMQDDPMPFVIK